MMFNNEEIVISFNEWLYISWVSCNLHEKTLSLKVRSRFTYNSMKGRAKLSLDLINFVNDSNRSIL